MVPVPILLAVSLSAVFLGFGCGKTVFQSTWKHQDIVVDGNYGDWNGDSLVYFDKPSMFVGIRNDTENLYVMIRTVDRRAQMKVMRLGLTLWIEPPDHPEKRWGVHYPVGLREHGIPLHGTGVPDDTDPEFPRKMNEIIGIMELLGPEKGHRIETVPGTPEGTDYGIRAAVRDTSGVIVYELRIPLHKSNGSVYTAWAGPGDRIGLRLETGDIREDKNPDEDDEKERYDPNRDTSTGKIKDKGRDKEREREERSRVNRARPMLNPLTEPISFRAEVILAADSSMGTELRR